MKIAKKILLTVLSTMMSVSLFACGNANSNAGSNSLGKSNSGKVSTKGDYKTGKEINISKTKLKYLDELVTNTFAMDDSSTSDSVMSMDAPSLLSTFFLFLSVVLSFPFFYPSSTLFLFFYSYFASFAFLILFPLFPLFFS